MQSGFSSKVTECNEKRFWKPLEQCHRSVCRILAFCGKPHYNNLCSGMVECLAMEVCHEENIEGYRSRTQGCLILIVEVLGGSW